MAFLTRFGTYLSKTLSKHYRLMILLALSIQLLFVFFFVLTNYENWDRGLWFNAVNNFTNKIPYLTTDDFVLGLSEYPICLTYYMLLLTPFSSSFELFSVALGLTQVFFSFITILLTYKLLLQLKLRRHKMIVLCAAPIYLSLSVMRFDLMPTAFLLGAVYYLFKRKEFTSGIFLGIGACLKIFPIFLIPAAVFMRKQINLNKLILSFALTVLALNLPALINHPISLLNPLKPAEPRPESMFGFLSLLGLMLPYQLINYLLIAVLSLVALIKVRKPLNLIVCLMITFIVSSTVFSPQWTIWLLPLLALINIKSLLILFYDWITIIEFPFIWDLVFNLTGFSSSGFKLTNPLILLFVLLNIARYVLLYHFFYKSLRL